MFQRSYILLPLCCCMAACSLIGGDSGDPLFSSVVAGEWTVEVEAVADVGACTQAYEGGPGTSLEMLLVSRNETKGGPYPSYPARISVQDSEGTSGTVDLACVQGINTGLDPWYLESLICTGELAQTFRPNPEVDAAWPVAVRIEGRYTMVAPCNMDTQALADFTGFDTTWTLSLTGTCSGADCGSSSLPLGADGEPLCIQKLRLLSEWSGCGEGDSACRPFTDHSQIPGCPY